MPALKEALDCLRAGRPVILVDDEDRENEGDLVLAAEFANAENINFFIRQACGLVCLALTPEQIERLGLPLMVEQNQTPRNTAFTISIEAKNGVTTGISAQDRAHTIQVAADPSSTRENLVSPGHIFPLRAVEGGVLRRAGHTEGSIELCRLAGLRPAAVICEIMNEDGSMARQPDLVLFSEKHNIPIVTMQSLIDAVKSTNSPEQGLRQEFNASGKKKVHHVTPEIQLPTEHGSFHARVYQSLKNKKDEVLIIYHLEPLLQNQTQMSESLKLPWVRIHSECVTGDVFQSQRCDCGDQLQASLKWIKNEGGILLYCLRHEGRGIGLFEKIRAYSIQESGVDTLDANLKLGHAVDLRDFQFAAEVLSDFLLEHQLKEIKLMTQNPSKKQALEKQGIHIQDVYFIQTKEQASRMNYMKAKRERLGHTIGKPLTEK